MSGQVCEACTYNTGYDNSGTPIIESQCEVEAVIPTEDYEDDAALPALLDFGTLHYEKASLDLSADNTNDYALAAISDTKTKTRWDGSISVKASLTLTFTTDNTQSYVANITKVNGSWTKSDSSVRIDSRKVEIYHSAFNKKATYRPSGNTFSYNVNWGELKWMGGGGCVYGATSTATLSRGIGGNPWDLTLQVVLSSDDF